MNSKEEVIHVIERLDDFCIHGAKMSASIVQTGVRKSYRCHKGRVPIQDEISHHLDGDNEVEGAPNVDLGMTQLNLEGQLTVGGAGGWLVKRWVWLLVRGVRQRHS
ncbi:hypothetical protein V6N11_024398 [Hibiscus sabdariffa]|uniref:Uncharacterized protein n=1 Tax=Hibiscus sabdariffa TaxID=183260 RepID=A0ABR2NF31_9ROSI